MNYIKFLSITLSFILSFSFSDSLIDYSKSESNEAFNSRKNQTESNSRTVTGTLISSFQGPSNSIGLTFDGTHLWISDRQEGLIKKYTLSGEMVSSIPSTCSDQRGLAWDGQNIWLACASPYSIYKLDPSDGTILDSFVYSGTGYPNGITFDGASNLWVNGWGSSSLIAYDSETFEQVTELSIGGGGRGLTFDGTHLWGAGDSGVNEINLEGELIETYDLPNTYIPGLAFDGQYIWASNMTTGMVYQYDVGIEIIHPENSTYVPDNNFEQALIDLGYDDVLDNYVLTETISTITSLDVSDRSISSLEGIEDFTALTSLYCYFNNLTSLDLSSNTLLTMVHSTYNQLASINVSENTLLTNLYLDNNQLSSIDVSQNTLLVELFTHTNPISNLDVSSNTLLTTLKCNSNQLTSLDVSSNTLLQILDCNSNQLASLDVGLNIELTSLMCFFNDLTTLDVTNNINLTLLNAAHNDLSQLDVSSNVLLETLYIPDNSLTSLDVSNNELLTELQCQQNDLTNLDISNNALLSTFFCGLNPNLSCINTDDPEAAAASWTVAEGNIDEGMIFSVSCDWQGCNDPYADNYNPIATLNDGTCSYDSDFAADYTFLGAFENSSYYKSNSNGLNWEEASAHAFNNGGHLATITSQEENDAVSSWITEVSIFGLFQNLNSSEYSEPDGGWEWITGEPLDYTSWYGNEPNDNGGSQHFGVYNFNSPSLWDDQSLTQVSSRVWILERSEDFVLGCNDPYADNYDEGATYDDGSCSGYPDNGDYALSFDGIDDYIEISNTDIFSNFNEMSINLYLKIADHEINGDEVVISKWNATDRPFNIWLSDWSGVNKLKFIINDGCSSNLVEMDVEDLILNNWNQITCVYSDINNLIQIYHNGLLKDQAEADCGPILNGSNNMIVGKHGDNINFLDGLVYNVSAWDIALNHEQINTYFNLNIEIERDSSYYSNKSLNSDRFFSETNFKKPNWDEMLSDLHLDSEKNKNLYNQK